MKDIYILMYVYNIDIHTCPHAKKISDYLHFCIRRDQLPELKEMAESMKDPNLKIPEYYYAPIHAYKDGNLCWDSALEEDLWSKLMIAPLYNNALDGDVQMRQQWLTITNRAIKPNPKAATDLVCMCMLRCMHVYMYIIMPYMVMYK